MDFETFKKDFERFSKIDTPEKLSMCEKQYSNHLLYIEDQRFFEPEIKREGNDLMANYYRDLRQILEFENIKENEFNFLIKPSFDPECLLTLTNISNTYLLTFNELETNYWAKVYTKNDVVVNLKKTQINISAVLGKKLFSLLNDTINYAKQSKAGGFTMDGVVYFLSKRVNGEIKTVTKHSPEETSRTGRVIAIALLLIDYIQSLDTKHLEAIDYHIEHLDNPMP